MNAKILIILGLAAAAAAGSSEEYVYRPLQSRSSEESSNESYRRSSEESYESSEAKYDFNYVVRDESSENDFGHQESRDGDYTQGSYYVRLPDSRLQTVKYYVDGDSGYVAEAGAFSDLFHWGGVKVYFADKSCLFADNGKDIITLS